MAIFRKAPGVEHAASGGSGGGADLAVFQSIDHLVASYWPAAGGAVLVLALLALVKREASAFVAGVAVVLQASLILSAQ